MSDNQTAFVPAPDRTEIIGALNDHLRAHLTDPGHNRVVMTAGVQAPIGDVTVFRNYQARTRLLRAIRDCEDFGPGVNPYGERDFGRLELRSEALYWKIDYYDRALEFASPDPTDANVTTRVLTILLTSEY